MLTRPVFRFKGCLRARRLHISASCANFSGVRPASTDDNSLTSIFDRSIPKNLTRPTGLFQHPMLHNPTHFKEVAILTLVRAQRVVDRILRAPSSRTEMLKVVKNLDRLSDMLCSVIDLAELVRSAHPDPVWVENANEAYEMLCKFMNVLNTHVGLYEVLKGVLGDPTIVETLSTEAHETALIFWRDFEKSGIDLPPQERDRFVALSSEILILGRMFLNGASTERPPATLEHQDIQGKLGRGLFRLKAKSSKAPMAIRPGSPESQLIMRNPFEEVARRKLYVASHSSTQEQIDVLERLLRARAELSRLVGRESFAHMTLEDKMAKTPENVQQFLETKLSYMQPQVSEAIRFIAQRKQSRLRLLELPPLYAWDREAFSMHRMPSPPVQMAALTAGGTFRGLSRLFSHLYGVSLRPAEITSGEVWHDDVRKLEVVDDDLGVIGWLYIDLFHREGKATGAAHYTVVCSRRTDDDDEGGDWTPDGDQNGPSMPMMPEIPSHHVSWPALRGLLPSNQYTIRGREGTYQLPVAVLMFDYRRPVVSGAPLYLEWQEVLTLCHEMGHAMHSMLARTEYHNVSGTRCATDFVELPSILMEHFLMSPEVLSLFVEPNSKNGMQYPSSTDATLGVLDDHGQILLGLIDQIYHSALPLNPAFDSTATYAQLLDKEGPTPYVPGTSWQTQFGHLYGYGATYYSYMLDRAIAGRVWEKLFKTNPLDRELGEKFKQEVLVHGGGRDPWEMLSKVLDAPELKQGDAEAMREVGRWRVEDKAIAPTMHS